MKTKKLIGLIAICALAVISFGSFFGLTRATINDIAGFDFKTVNEANYFNVDFYTLTNASGSPYEISDDGEITIDFDFGSSIDTYIDFQLVQLDAGKYELKSGVRGTSKETYNLVLREVDAQGEFIENGDIIFADTTFEVKGTTTYKACIYIAGGQECEDVTFTPILVDKGQKAKFYVYDFNIFDNE